MAVADESELMFANSSTHKMGRISKNNQDNSENDFIYSLVVSTDVNYLKNCLNFSHIFST